MQNPIPPSEATFAVFVDTNILWSEDKRPCVNQEFEQFWKVYSTQFNIKLYIPEVVLGELKFLQVESAKKKLKRARNELDFFSQIIKKDFYPKATLRDIKWSAPLRLHKK